MKTVTVMVWATLKVEISDDMDLDDLTDIVDDQIDAGRLTSQAQIIASQSKILVVS